MKRFYIDAGDDVVTFEHEGETVTVTGSGLDNVLSKPLARDLWAQLIKQGGKVIDDPERPIVNWKALNPTILEAAAASLRKHGLLK